MPWIDQPTIDLFINSPHSGYYDSYNLSCGRGEAVDMNFQGQNGKNKYDGNHPAFQLIQRQARDSKWSSYFHWEQSYQWLKKQIPMAFDLLKSVGCENPNSRVIKKISSKARQLRPWSPKTIIEISGQS
jgi:hypothetical protein